MGLTFIEIPSKEYAESLRIFEDFKIDDYLDNPYVKYKYRKMNREIDIVLDHFSAGASYSFNNDDQIQHWHKAEDFKDQILKEVAAIRERQAGQKMERSDFQKSLSIFEKQAIWTKRAVFASIFMAALSLFPTMVKRIDSFVFDANLSCPEPQSTTGIEVGIKESVVDMSFETKHLKEKEWFAPLTRENFEKDKAAHFDLKRKFSP